MLRWYRRNGRTLPWRLPAGHAGNITNAYRILISEIMLQQTQVSRVLIKYPEFLKRFPSLRSLARARQRDVVIAWKGMGYNNRAVRLHQLAQAVTEHHGGRIPSTFEQLIALPGVGRYTANALLSSAFGKRAAIVDVNVQRVLSRIFWTMKSFDARRAALDIWTFAEHILPTGRVYDWNQALMDFGATVCTARQPQCPRCPVMSLCKSRSSMMTRRASISKREATLNGIPNRIHRGRIIERLRSVNNSRPIRFHTLGKSILPNFSVRHHAWFALLLSGLAKDGLVRIAGNGSLKNNRVSLA
ncbi:MAG: A/G-specific adenine glycosylase [Ignavibacteriae bacterium]|nr:A/G-specific adenine glycosylase [Ignavibacteriota bacterium]